MFQENEIANARADLVDLHDSSECVRSIESAINSHPKGKEAVAFLRKCGVEEGDLLNLLDLATHPSSKRLHERAAHIFRKYKESEEVFRQAADGARLIRSDVIMCAMSSFPNGVAPQNTENENLLFAEVLAKSRKAWMKSLRLRDTHMFRWGVFALELRGRLKRPPPWKRLAVLLESAYLAHGIEVDIGANQVRLAEINLRSKDPLTYGALARMSSAQIKGGDDAMVMQMCVEWASVHRGEPNKLRKRSGRAQKRKGKAV